MRAAPVEHLPCAVAILTIAALLGCRAAEEQPPPATPRVKVYEVGTATTGQVRTLSGVLAAAKSSALSFGVAGTVSEVTVSTGDTVTKSQILARLDTRPLLLAARRARADLASVRAKSVNAEQEFARAQRLSSQGALSKAKFEAATAQRRSVLATLEGSASAVEQAERDLARTTLVAPFDGRIAKRSVDPFQEVSAGEPLFVIQGSKGVVAKVQVPETLIRFVEYGDAVKVRLPGFENREFPAQVSLIGATGGTGSAFPVEVRLNDPPEALRPGMTASVTFSFADYLEGKTAYLIPLSAVAIDQGLRQASNKSKAAPVFIVDETSSVLRLQSVRISGLRGNQLEVLEGLKPGDRVVSAGLPFLREGMKVAIWDPSGGIE